MEISIKANRLVDDTRGVRGGRNAALAVRGAGC
jgi:hypothetical protein